MDANNAGESPGESGAKRAYSPLRRVLLLFHRSRSSSSPLRRPSLFLSLPAYSHFPSHIPRLMTSFSFRLMDDANNCVPSWRNRRTVMEHFSQQVASDAAVAGFEGEKMAWHVGGPGRGKRGEVARAARWREQGVGRSGREKCSALRPHRKSRTTNVPTACFFFICHERKSYHGHGLVKNENRLTRVLRTMFSRHDAWPIFCTLRCARLF